MSDVRSSAVIKYSATKTPARYNELATNTNLNSPPRDWLLGRFARKEPWAPGRAKHHKQFTSFSMANSYIDQVGKVDVITDAENIKKLLKVNYSGAPVSMILHRVGRTLMIDSMDVYRSLLFAKGHEWQWFKKFISNTLNSSDSMALTPVAALNRQDLEANLMMSKFLYHSLDESEDNLREDAFFDNNRRMYPGVADPLASEEDEFNNVNKFERNVLWNFEDIRMLIGTDLPIFGAGTHPCVTLRLRDMKKPISVLTGIDYWLDQLMCTVPEVVMCYHLNGIVQRYEVVKTEDLPDLPESSFSPELIRDVAQNILSFLKSNATKEGHTYWLFKDKDDDIVKLYDLTCVCQEYMEETDVNPFTLPVAVLMYRVARNLLQRYTKHGTNVINTVYRLLTHCLELLDEEKFPQVVGSAHYFLANLYVIRGSKDTASGGGDHSLVKEVKKSADGDGPQSMSGDQATAAQSLPDAPFDELGDDSFDYNDWYLNEQSNCTSATHCDTSVSNSLQFVSCISLDRLSINSDMRSAEQSSTPVSPKMARFIPNSTNMEDSWQSALEHVFKALECVKTFDEQLDKAQKSTLDADRLEMADGRPIALHYESLAHSRSSVDLARSSLLPLAVRFPNATGWRLNLTLLLLTKAFNVYFLLADCAFRLDNYGKALRYLKYGFVCYEGAQKVISSTCNSGLNEFNVEECKHMGDSMLPQLLLLCGDIHVMMSKLKAMQVGKHVRDFNVKMYRDEKIVAQAEQILADSKQEYGWCTFMSTSIEETLQLSQNCYERAISCMRDKEKRTTDALTDKSHGHFDQNDKPDKEKRMDDKNIKSIVDLVLLSKRLGNVKNSLGVYYMNLSSAHMAKSKGDQKDDLKRMENCWHSSYACFQEGIRIFNRLNDKDNEALLTSNAARLMRLCSSFYATPNQPVNADEEHYLNRAIEMYQRALECVSPGSSENRVWESVAWELSSVYFTYAVHMQDRPPLNLRKYEEVEKVIVDMMQKALRLVERLDSLDQSKHAVYLYRIASIHHKLASLYHLSFRSKESLPDRKLKQLKSLIELHYKKASDGFQECVIESPTEFIMVQIERVVLLEESVEVTTNAMSKLKLYAQALDLILNCRTAFMNLCRKSAAEKSDAASSSDSGVDSVSKSGPAEEFLVNNDILSSDEANDKIETLNDDGSADEKPPSARRRTDEKTGTLTEMSRSACLLTLRRLRAITKSALVICRSSSKDNVSTDQWKAYYAASLVHEPSDLGALPSTVLSVLEEIASLKGS